MVNTRKSFITLLTLFSLFTTSTCMAYSGGSGTAEDPYQIADANDLLALAANTDDYGQSFVLTADIDLDGQIFVRAVIAANLGSGNDFYGVPFYGIFDGNGHKITNFVIDGGNNRYLGLFGYIEYESLVKNLGVEDFSINCSNNRLVGGLAGRTYYANIINCYSTGAISGANSNCIGSLVGKNYNSNIINCYSTGNISGYEIVGGLVGESFNSSIDNCYSTGAVSGGYADIGGLVGYNYGGSSISESYSTSHVSGIFNVGGLIGFNGDSNIDNCYSTGVVSASSGSVASSFGGLIGRNANSEISNCYSTSEVRASYDVGGLVGMNRYSSINNCYSKGSVRGSLCGGLVGNNYASSISNCYSTASASGSCCYIGGLVGTSSYDCDISNCYSTGAVSGSSEIGGLIGENYGTVSNSYSTGAVTGDESVGGLIGISTDRIDNSFWDTQTSGQPSSDGGTGKTTAEMTMLSTFASAGWDFTTPVWTLKENIDYPRLWWQLQLEPPVLHAEQQITLGTGNVISWDTVADADEYYAQCADDANFTNVLYDSGWTNETSCEFTGLEIGQIYWYRVKAKVAFGTESDWSNVESSLQGTLVDVFDKFIEPNSLKNKLTANALRNKINSTTEMIEQGLYKEAINKLKNDILQKTDGCANGGQPDKNDWITTCEAQGQFYPYIMETIEYLEGLIQ